MAVAFVQGLAGPNANTSSVAASFSTLPAVGNRIVVAVAGRGDFGTASLSVSDNQGHTYTQANTIAQPVARVAGLYYCDVVTSSGTFTVTATNASTFNPVTMFAAGEFSGVGALDQITTPASGFGTTEDTGVLAAASAAGCLEVAGLFRDGSPAIVVDSYTPAYANAANNTTLSEGICLSYRVLTGSTNVGCSWGTPGTTDWAAVGATFVAASGGGGPAFLAPRPALPRQAMKRASYY